MSCDPLKFDLPPTFKGCTWSGVTWTVDSVTDGDTEFADTLVSARFQLKDANNVSVLSLSSAIPGEIILNSTAPDAWSITVATTTINVEAGTYSYALETTDASGVILPRLEGNLRVKNEPIV